MRLVARHGWGTAAGVVLLVAAALVVVIGAGALVTSHDRDRVAQQAFARAVVDRAAGMADALDSVEAASRADVLRRFNAADFRVWISQRPPPPAGPSWNRGAAVEEEALAALPAARRDGAWVRAVPGRPAELERDDEPRRLGPDDWRHGFYTLIVALPLQDGGWVVAAAPARPLASRPGTIALVALGLFVLAVVAVAMVVARRMARPLVTLAGAADRLSTDLDAPPLPEHGSREMRRAAAAFNTMQARLRRMVDDRTLMLAALSHDMRTVITRLRLRAEEIDDEVQRGKALQDLSDMEVMLREALDAARGEVDREARQKTDLAALARSLVDDLADAGRDVRCEGPERLVASCRPVALRRALSNLIDNALRYGTMAEVSLRPVAGGVEIDVADRGPGIPEGAREEMFRPFMRGESSRSRQTGGTGLGLGVARSVLRAHGGDVVLLDRTGGGLIARMSLPFAPGD